LQQLPNPADPPANVRIEVEGDDIRVYGDDQLIFDVVDPTHRDHLAEGLIQAGWRD